MEIVADASVHGLAPSTRGKGPRDAGIGDAKDCEATTRDEPNGEPAMAALPPSESPETSSPVSRLLPVPVALLRSLALVCLSPDARIELPPTRFPHLVSLRIVAADCDLAPFRVDRALAASRHLTD